MDTGRNARILGEMSKTEARREALRWHVSRATEFMLVGGLTLVLFPLAWLLRKAVGLDSSELAVGMLTFYAAFVINDPHFAVTYLLFYKDVRNRALSPAFTRAQRVRYVVAGLVVPFGLCAWAATALRLHSAQSLGWMIQLMFLLVGWHYAKQGFGVLTVLSARRGVRITPRERNVLLLHCYAGWAFAWANPTTAAGEFEEKGVVYWAPGHPRWLELATGAVLAASTVALVVVLVARWRREREMLPLAPLAGLLVTVWSWTIFSSLDPLLRYVIPALHSVQYFFFVWLMKRNEARAHEGPPSFGRPVAVRLGLLAVSALGLGFLLFRGLPDFLDSAFVPRPMRGAAPDPLGDTPFFAAIFVVVNIHHYFMDHVIWRRDNPDTRYLRDPEPAAANAEGSPSEA
jgi:hypothetical protein